MLLKSLSSTPFDDMKYLARDALWMADSQHGEKLIDLMHNRELYVEVAREDMMQEDHSTFLARWDDAVREVVEQLPTEYLQLGSDEVKMLPNFTQGKLTMKAVNEWVRVKTQGHEIQCLCREFSARPGGELRCGPGP